MTADLTPSSRAKHADSILLLQRLSDYREELNEWSSRLWRMSMEVSNDSLAESYVGASQELNTLAMNTNSEITRLSFLLSLDLEE